MIQGDMCLDVIERGRKRSIPIREGEMFLLPGRIPHSPQRKAGTVGLVIERQRMPDEVDGLRWYVPGSEGATVLYQEWFHCTNLGAQLKPVIERFFASDAYRTKIPSSDWEDTVEIDTESVLPDPLPIAEICSTAGSSRRVYDNTSTCEFAVDVSTGATDDDRWSAADGVTVRGQAFFYSIRGETHVSVASVDDDGAWRTVVVPAGGVFLTAEAVSRVRVTWPTAGLAIVVTCGRAASV